MTARHFLFLAIFLLAPLPAYAHGSEVLLPVLALMAAMFGVFALVALAIAGMIMKNTRGPWLVRWQSLLAGGVASPLLYGLMNITVQVLAPPGCHGNVCILRGTPVLFDSMPAFFAVLCVIIVGFTLSFSRICARLDRKADKTTTVRLGLAQFIIMASLPLIILFPAIRILAPLTRPPEPAYVKNMQPVTEFENWNARH
jgi:hypothetical protein